MKRVPKTIPHGSGQLTARGRLALWGLLEPRVEQACQLLHLGTLLQSRRIDSGSHHLVWRVRTNKGIFALRPSVTLGNKPSQTHKKRERLWRAVGKWGVAPVYHGSVPLRIDGFSGQMEAFDWIDGRHLNPTADAVFVARTLAILHSKSAHRFADCAPRVELRSFLGHELNDYLRQNQDKGALASRLRKETRESLLALQTMPQSHSRDVLVHNDLVDGNVIQQDGHIRLIDWDWAMIGSPVIDLFCFLSPFVRSWGKKPRFLSVRTLRSFLDGYSAERGGASIGRLLRSDAAYWRPYNILLANWLYQEATPVHHATGLEFFERCFRELDRIGQVIDGFK